MNSFERKLTSDSSATNEQAFIVEATVDWFCVLYLGDVPGLNELEEAGSLVDFSGGRVWSRLRLICICSREKS